MSTIPAEFRACRKLLRAVADLRTRGYSAFGSFRTTMKVFRGAVRLLRRSGFPAHTVQSWTVAYRMRNLHTIRVLQAENTGGGRTCPIVLRGTEGRIIQFAVPPVGIAAAIP